MPVSGRFDFSEENIRGLLAEQHESETLDYKSHCDLSDHDQLIEVVKDIAAMSIDGGYILFGADDNGNPTDQVQGSHLRQFEQASLRSKIGSFLPEPFDVRAASLRVDGHLFILLVVGAHPDFFVTFQKHEAQRETKPSFVRGKCLLGMAQQVSSGTNTI